MLFSCEVVDASLGGNKGRLAPLECGTSFRMQRTVLYEALPRQHNNLFMLLLLPLLHYYCSILGAVARAYSARFNAGCGIERFLVKSVVNCESVNIP